MIIRKNLVTLCLLFTFLSSYSQKIDNRIDSLKGLLRHKTGPGRVDVLFDLSYNQVEINNDTALRYGLDVKEVSNALAYSYFERISAASGHISHFAQPEHHEGVWAS